MQTKPATSRKSSGKNRLNKPLRANQDLAKLLISTPEFQADVQAIRKHFGIPVVGTDCTDEEYQQTMSKLTKEGEALLDSPAFLREEAAIAKDFHDKKISKTGAGMRMQAHFDRIWWQYVNRQAELLCGKYNIPYLFTFAIERYITCSELVFIPSEKFSIGRERVSGSGSDKKCVVLRVYAKLLDGDLEHIKRTVNNGFGHDLPRHTAIQNLDQKLQYEQWYKDAKRYQENSHERVLITELAEENLGHRHKAQDIHNAIRGLKSLRKKRLVRRRANQSGADLQ